jgi:hypothetical protein
MSQNPPENVPEVASHGLLSFEDRCRAWLEKQPNWEAKVELGKLLMIPLMELSSTQLARLEELREVLKDNADVEAPPRKTPNQEQG